MQRNNEMFNEREAYFQSPSEYRKKICEQRALAEFKTNVTIDFFKLYDGCTNLEEMIQNTNVRKSHEMHPCGIAFGILIFTSGILGVLSYLTHNNPDYYANNEVYVQNEVQVCRQRPEHGVPSIFKLFSTKVACWTEISTEHNLSRFEILTMISLFAAVLTMIAQILETDLLETIEALDKFLETFHFLGKDSRRVVFEEFDLETTLDNLKISLEIVKNPEIKPKDIKQKINQMSLELGKIKKHLIKQDKEGYFSNNLPPEVAKYRKERNLYVNVVDELSHKLKI